MADLEGILGASPHAPMESAEGRVTRTSSTKDARSSSYLIDPATLLHDPEVEAAVRLVLDGKAPRFRELKSWEPERLHARHVSAVLMKCLGIPNNIIAEIVNYTESRVSIILRHPDSVFLIRKVMAKTASTTAVDITARLRQETPGMLDIIHDIAHDDEAKDDTRLKAAFGWIDRAGYGETRKVEATHRVVMEKSHARLLSTAIREAGEIKEADYVIVGDSSNGSADPAAEDVPPPASVTNSDDGVLRLPPPKEDVA